MLALLPVIGRRCSYARAAGEKRWLVTVLAGMALRQFPAAAVEKLTGSICARFVPGLGLFLVLLGVVALKSRRRTEPSAGAGGKPAEAVS